MAKSATKSTTNALDPAATWEPINSLTPWDKNPRKNDGEPVDRVAKSIERFGFAAPIVARAADRVIIAGHTRWKAARKLGMDKVPVRFVDLDPDQAAALALADNRLTEITPWDDAGLADVLRELEAASVDLDGLGWDAEALDAILNATAPIDASETDDDVPEVDDGPAVSARGEVYHLGPHLLFCDSCLDPGVRSAAIGPGVDAIIADPPYGTGINAKGGLGNSKVPMALIGDEDPELARRSVLAFAGVGAVQVWWGANYYSDACTGSPCWIVWDKDHHGMTFADAELAWVTDTSPVRVFRHAWSGMRRASERDTAREHPTQKPVALYVWTMDGRVPEGGTILDPFGGSGSTLIAAAQTGRVARLIELDPKYCDVIRRRWHRYATEHGLDVGDGLP